MKKIITLAIAALITVAAYPKIKVTLELPNNCNASTPVINHEVLQPSITLFPNPSSERFTLEMQNNEVIGKVTVSIITIEGRVASSVEIYGSSKHLIHTITTAQLTAGTYLVRVTTSQNSFKKIILIHK